jgi:phospholipase C
VTNTVHDHTSILATIEAKWNLPACTMRDANAATLADFLDTSHAAYAEPPALAASHDIADSEANCSDADPHLAVQPNPPKPDRAVSKRKPRKHKHKQHPGKKHHHKKKHHRAHEDGT